MTDSTFIRTLRCGCTGRPDDVHAPDCPADPERLEAYRELEAAVRELESRAANVAMPMIRNRIRAALAALDRTRQ